MISWFLIKVSFQKGGKSEFQYVTLIPFHVICHILSCYFTIYTMDYPKFILLNQKKESVST